MFTVFERYNEYWSRMQWGVRNPLGTCVGLFWSRTDADSAAANGGRLPEPPLPISALTDYVSRLEDDAKAGFTRD